ncbi:MAG: hypothetical protein H0T76_22420 [Nannocystis sp.]|nr:hypothetical protein [Nannocystis sp.]MBA3549237.1 hypothetical protein [Nannocystis sp.]
MLGNVNFRLRTVHASVESWIQFTGPIDTDMELASTTVRARLAQKRVQLREGRDPAPGIAIVVAFKDAIVRMEDA